MAKRPAPDTSEELAASSRSDIKRQQTDQRQHSQTATSATGPANIAALSGLLKSSEELIECLQQLKRLENSVLQQDSHNADLIAAQQRLCAISQSAIPQLQILSQGLNPKSEESIAAKLPTSLLDQKGNATQPLAVDAWRASDISRKLPPMPPVKDPKLETTALTHKGISSFNHYERLEWVGDAYLELIATAFLDKTFPKLPSGRLSQMRERLIRNTQLAEYFREYRMQSRAKLPANLANREDLGRGSSRDKDLLKTQGDMFEAYVAAVILSDPINGLRDAVSWLKALWGRTIYDDIRKEESTRHEQQDRSGHGGEKPRTKSPKEELTALLVVKGIVIHYETMPCSKKDKHHNLPLFAVGAYLDGWGETHKLLGVGTALSTKEAGQKAAAVALQNKKLISQYEAKKRSFQAAKMAAEEGGK